MYSHDILAVARERGSELSLPYAGAVTPEEAFALLKVNLNVKLIDVRTNAERDWVGKVEINDIQHKAVQWSTYPGSIPNPDFLAQLQQVASKENILLFLCRSGVRSRHAAKLAAENGYAHSYDILEGFEGNKNADGQRKTVGGWCHAELPWTGA